MNQPSTPNSLIEGVIAGFDFPLTYFFNGTGFDPKDTLRRFAGEILRADRTAAEIHYPDCWDTAAYPTVQDAIKAIGAFKCGECTPAAPVVAEGRENFEALMRADGWGAEHFQMHNGFEGLGYTSQSMQGAWRCYRAILAAHPVAVSQNDIEMVSGALGLCEPEDQEAFKRILQQI